MTLYACSKKDDYKFITYTENDIKALYDNNMELFNNLGNAIKENEQFWEKGRRDNESVHAWIMSPNDEKKMNLFTPYDQNIISEFFDKTKPYMVSLDDKQYITITFINSNNTGWYCLVYYFDKKSIDSVNETTYFEEWVDSRKSNYKVFKVINNDWFLYY